MSFSAVLSRVPHNGADLMSKTASNASEKILVVEDLTVSFDGFRAVDALSLSVDRNELRVIIGPNGAGKTTLLGLR